MKNRKFIIKNIMLTIWSTFPTVDFFRNFIMDDRNISIKTKFIELAFREGLLQERTDAEFERLLNQCSELFKNRKPPMEFTFDALIGNIKQNTSIKSLVNELQSIAEVFDFSKPDEVMFTRLKKDFYPNSMRKQHALMLLSLWLSLHKPELSLNSQNILDFPRHSSESVEDEKTGVLSTISFIGEYINASMIDFMKSEMTKCIKDLNIIYLNERRIQYLATTCMLRFPLKEGIAGFPSSYGEALRDALALAYQMIITWQLSPIYDARIHLIIAIDAGFLSTAELTIKDILAVELPFDYSIRLSNFAFTIASGMAEQKIIFKETKYPNVWSVEHFWMFPHMKGPPCLMPQGKESENNDELLPVRNETAKAFSEALVLGEGASFKILSIINQYPPKVLSALEISNILTLRRLHHAAVRLLSHIIMSDPKNYVARTLRMSNFTFMGNLAEDYESAEIFYNMAIHDGEFVARDCPPDPVFYAEYSQIYWSKAVKLIKLLRKGRIKEGIDARMSEILDCIKKVEYYAGKGMIARAAADTRCTTYFMHFTALRHLLEKDRDLLTARGRNFEDTYGIYSYIVKPIFNCIGWFAPTDGDGSGDEPFWDKRMSITVGVYLNSISLTSFYVTILFTACTVIWDFAEPERKKRIIDHVLFLLNIALEKTEALKKLCLGVFSITPGYPVIQSPAEFIQHIKNAIHVLEKIKKIGNYETGMKLFLLHFDDDVSSKPITFDLIQAEEKM